MAALSLSVSEELIAVYKNQDISGEINQAILLSAS